MGTASDTSTISTTPRFGGLRAALTAAPRWLPWTVNVICLVVMAAAVYSDRSFLPALETAFSTDLGELDTRQQIGWGIAATGAATFLAMLAGLMFGGARSRNMLALMMFATLAGGWLGTAVNLRNIAWYGERHRLKVHLTQLEALAGPLRDQWPDQDGCLSGLGPFMGYPVYNVRTLVLLTPPALAPGGPSIAVVERTERGGLLFELTGTGAHDWLEWHPENERPDSRIGGLADVLEMQRSLPMGGGWYLVRYTRG